jgi:hypothetical protein
LGIHLLPTAGSKQRMPGETRLACSRFRLC